jgi:DNA-binding GntR family transcriptional regulator
MSAKHDVSRASEVGEVGRAKSPMKLPVSMTEVVYQTLREEMSQGIIGPGQIHLQALSERLGVSVAPVREALRRLEAEGLVSFGPKRRVRVNQLTVEELNEIFSIRIRLESLAVELAVKHLSSMPDEISQLRNILLEMDQLESSPGDWQAQNERFHKRIYSFAQMPRLESMISSLWIACGPYIRLHVRSRPGFHDVQEEHKLLLRQIESGDADGASGILRMHLIGTLNMLRKRLPAGDEKTPDESTSPRPP